MTEPVSLTDIERHLRIDDDDHAEAAYLLGMIVAARRSSEASIRRTLADLDADETAVLAHAILLIVAHWYRNREAVLVGSISSALPWSADALLDTLRSYDR